MYHRCSPTLAGIEISFLTEYRVSLVSTLTAGCNRGENFSGDAVYRDGFHFITGRVDDVLNVASHRDGGNRIGGASGFRTSGGGWQGTSGEAITGFDMLAVTYEVNNPRYGNNASNGCFLQKRYGI